MQLHTGQKAREVPLWRNRHYTTKGTVVNRGCIGKPRVTKAICFYVRKNTLQIEMNLNQSLKSLIKGNFVRGQNKDCEICSNLFVCMYV